MGLGLLAVVILGVPRLVPEARLVWTVLGLVIVGAPGPVLLGFLTFFLLVLQLLDRRAA